MPRVRGKVLPAEYATENDAYCKRFPITVVTIMSMNVATWIRVVVTAIVIPVLT